MNSRELREKFLEYFEKKEHKIIPSSSLIPEDKTVVLTSAGMQQLIPYLSGEKDVLEDFENRHLTSSQKCFRTVDIDNVGDDTHHTFFEMLGNWSIGVDNNGEYFKEGAIKYALDFFVNEMDLDKNKIYVTVFKGENAIPRDEESIRIWQENKIPLERIKEFGFEDNFWGPTSSTGPCGPCSEIHYDRGENYGCGEECGPNCEKCKRFVELWNLVFMEYNKNQNGQYEKLSQTNVDTGIGFERLLSVLNKTNSAYETDLFLSIIKEIEKLSTKNYKLQTKNYRIIADHIKAAVFILSEGIEPSNVEQGYVLRRLIRRSVRYAKQLGIEGIFCHKIAKVVIGIYKDIYPELWQDKDFISEQLIKEEEKFEKTLERGLRQFEKLEKITGQDAFDLYQSYGFPLELTEELAREKGIKVDKDGFEKALKEHQKVSRKGAEHKFKGGLADHTEQTIKYHTATHLLLAALRRVLGDHVYQKGSNITSERLRFDFSHKEKLSEQEIKEVERLVNEKIEQDLEVKSEEMSLDEAKKQGAMGVFGEKYGDKVKVYSIGDFSKEICGGPHAKRTSELGTFKIVKEGSSSAGVRRIRAVLE